MLCESCGKEQNNKYASGRFCDRSCASSFSTRASRKEINIKVSEKLKGKGKGANAFSPEQKAAWLVKVREGIKTHRNKFYTKAVKFWKETNENPSEDRVKGLLEFERGKKCELCDWAEINPHTGTIPVELEHKDGDCYNNTYENVCYLCPNHHSLTSTFRGANAGKGRGRKHCKLVSAWAKERRLAKQTEDSTGSAEEPYKLLKAPD